MSTPAGLRFEWRLSFQFAQRRHKSCCYRKPARVRTIHCIRAGFVLVIAGAAIFLLEPGPAPSTNAWPAGAMTNSQSHGGGQDTGRQNTEPPRPPRGCSMVASARHPLTIAQPGAGAGAAATGVLDAGVRAPPGEASMQRITTSAKQLLRPNASSSTSEFASSPSLYRFVALWSRGRLKFAPSFSGRPGSPNLGRTEL